MDSKKTKISPSKLNETSDIKEDSLKTTMTTIEVGYLIRQL